MMRRAVCMTPHLRACVHGALAPAYGAHFQALTSSAHAAVLGDVGEEHPFIGRQPIDMAVVARELVETVWQLGPPMSQQLVKPPMSRHEVPQSSRSASFLKRRQKISGASTTCVEESAVEGVGRLRRGLPSASLPMQLCMNLKKLNSFD